MQQRFVSALLAAAAFAVFGLGTLQGCFLEPPAQDGTSCMEQNTVTFVKVLTPEDPEFVLATSSPAPVINNYCTATLTLSATFVDQNLRTASLASHNIGSIPLTGLSDSTLFFLDYVHALSEGWLVSQTVPDTAFGAAYTLTVTTAPRLPGATSDYEQGTGQYSIRTRLAPGITNADSSIRVSGSIRYRHQ